MNGRERRQVRFAAPVRDERPLQTSEIRSFVVRCAVLVAAMGLVYWLGWKSPWARADLRVRVEAPDAPKAAPAPVAAQQATVESAPSSTEAIRPESASTETLADDEKQPRRRRRHRQLDNDSTARD